MPSALAGQVEGVQGGAGTIEVTVELRNTGSTSCTLDGFPGLSVVSADGSDVPGTVQPGGPLRFESVAPSLVTVAPGAAGYVNIGLPDTPGAGQTSCPTASSLAVTPPGLASALTVPVQLQVCAGGTIHVSAVFAATSAAAATMAPPASS